MALRLQKFANIWIFVALFTSVLMSTLYSVLNTDPHHWGFILGTALDFIHGRLLFTEIYIQYGAGSPLFFWVLNHFLPVNYTSIGIYTSIFYVGTLCILFLGLKKVSSLWAALIIFSAVYLIHPFSIYPWADYYAGFFLAAGAYFLIPDPKRSSSWISVLVGLFFFLSVLFRSTYGMSLLAAGVSYAVIALIDKSLRNRSVLISLASSFVFLSIYLVFLSLQGKLSYWFAESLGAGSSLYGIGILAVIPLIRNAFIPYKFYLPNRLILTSWVALHYFAVYIILRIVLRYKRDAFESSKLPMGIILFFAFLGMAGLAQGTLLFEVFRLQNSCSPLYLMLGASIAVFFPNFETVQLQSRGWQAVLVIFFILMIAKFPYASTLWPVYDGKVSDYETIDNPVFKGHRFQADQVDYYKKISTLMCDGKSMIANMTYDSTLGYLCEGQASEFALPFYHASMLKIIDPEKIEAAELGHFKENEIILAESPIIKSPEVKILELGKVNRPASTRWLGKATITVYQVQGNH